MSSAAGTPKWPGDHAEKHRQAALLGWARKRGFTRAPVKRGRRKSEPTPPKAPPPRGMELARQVQVSAQRTRPYAHSDYSPHAGNVARLTLMHELGMEQDAAKRAKIRRELRKLGVPSDQIPKEPRKPRAVEKMSTFQLNQEMGAASGERRAAILAELARRRGERHEAARKPRRAPADKNARDAENIRLLRESIADAPDRIRRARAAGNEADARFWENGLREDRAKLKRYEARQARDRSAAVSQLKAARKRGGGAS